MNKNQQGFAHSHLVLFIVVIGLIVAVGLYVNRRSNERAQLSGQSTTANTQDPVSTDSEEELGTKQDEQTPAQNAPAPTAKPAKPTDPTDWKVLSKRSVTLVNWGVQMSVPADLVGKATYRYKADASPYMGFSPKVEAYQFATKKITDNASCMSFFSPGLEGIVLYRFSAKKQGGGLVYDEDKIKEDLTLAEYYQRYKASGGNYFSRKRGLGDFRWYKIGDYFYTFGGHMTAYIDKNEWNPEFSGKCKTDSPQFYEPFMNTMLPTIKAKN